MRINLSFLVFKGHLVTEPAPKNLLKVKNKHIRLINLIGVAPQPAATCSKSTMETPEQCVKSVHS